MDARIKHPAHASSSRTRRAASEPNAIRYTPPKPATHVPVIDFADAFAARLDARKAVAREIHKACRDTGFFYLANHGAPRALVAAQFECVFAMIALSLELPEDWFAPMFDMPGITLRRIRYPPHPTNAKPNQLGAGAHTDWGGVTLLAQDDAGGLEVRNIADEWIDGEHLAEMFHRSYGYAPTV